MGTCCDPHQQDASADPKDCSCCGTEVTPVALSMNKTMGQIRMFSVQDFLYSQ